MKYLPKIKSLVNRINWGVVCSRVVQAGAIGMTGINMFALTLPQGAQNPGYHAAYSLVGIAVYIAARYGEENSRQIKKAHDDIKKTNDDLENILERLREQSRLLDNLEC